jgi:hypothetical protein
MYERCDNCFFSLWMMTPDRPVLTCKQKVPFNGRWRGVVIDDSCEYFYPSSTCKAGSRAGSKAGSKAGSEAGSNIERRIPLTRGKFAIVDWGDYYRLSQFRWHAVFNSKTFYAARIERGKTIKMHREIMGAPKDLVVDHVDRDGLNNRRGNLRLCSAAENGRNTGSSARGTSKYKGVHWHKGARKWAAAIQYNKKVYHIGYFGDEVEAAEAYDKKAREFFGEYGYLNFPPEAESSESLKLKV